MTRTKNNQTNNLGNRVARANSTSHSHSHSHKTNICPGHCQIQ